MPSLIPLKLIWFRGGIFVFCSLSSIRLPSREPAPQHLAVCRAPSQPPLPPRGCLGGRFTRNPPWSHSFKGSLSVWGTKWAPETSLSGHERGGVPLRLQPTAATTRPHPGPCGLPPGLCRPDPTPAPEQGGLGRQRQEDTPARGTRFGGRLSGIPVPGARLLSGAAQTKVR